MSSRPETRSDLERWLDSQPVTLGAEWLKAQEARKQNEADFHDAYRDGHQDESHGTSSNHRFYEAADVVNDYADRWIRRWAPDGASTFLDFACGHGAQTIKAVRAGARLALGIDISEISIGNARENAASLGLEDRAHFLQRDCENTGIPDASFSAGLCFGMLHHLDLSRAFPELSRLMVPGGRILCVEALSYNPVIQLYRKLTPGLRTQWEKDHILGMREVRYAEQWFDVQNVRFFLMAAPLATLVPWEPARNVLLGVGRAIDSIATRVPGLQLWSWQIAFELVKR